MVLLPRVARGVHGGVRRTVRWVGYRGGMTPEILLVPSSVTLVPGATGRSEVARDERDALVGALARTLAAAAQGVATARGATSLAPDGIRGVRVVVVAPAPVSRSRTTDGGMPDLGAVGVAGVVDRASLDIAPRGAGNPDPEPHGVRLHVPASVVTILLRLAGWRGPIRTVEIGGDEAVAGEPRLAPELLWTGPQDEVDGDPAPVLVFTTLSGHARGTDSPRDSGDGRSGNDVEPSGVPELLRRADRTVAALYRDAVSGS